MRVLLFILLMAIYAFAADMADSSVVASADSLPKQDPSAKNIPLPRQTSYTGRGLSIGVGAGVFDPTEDCDCLGVWQAQLEYFYNGWVSAGIDARFFGGDLDDDVMLMYQRYRLNTRFHLAWSLVDLFIEPVLGFENTSISEFRHQMKHHTSSKPQDDEVLESDSSMVDVVEPVDKDSVGTSSTGKKSVEDCEKMFSLDGFSIGIGAGFGLRLSRFWGLTGSALFEYNFSRAMQLSLTPGVAFDLQKLWPWAEKNLLSTWISAEFGAQRYFNRGVKEWSMYVFLGLQLGI